MVNKPKDPQPRLNREEWLEKAIEVLSREGSGKLRVQGLSEALGVSKGSFYWHFKDRAEFLRAIVEFWSERYTKKVITAAEASGAEGLECLRMVLEWVTGEDLSGYDATFDAWAAHEPDILPLVREVHRLRHDFVERQFSAMGYSGRELALRTQAFMGYMKYRSQHSLSWDSLKDPGGLEDQLEFFTK